MEQSKSTAIMPTLEKSNSKAISSPSTPSPPPPQVTKSSIKTPSPRGIFGKNSRKSDDSPSSPLSAVSKTGSGAKMSLLPKRSVIKSSPRKINDAQQIDVKPNRNIRQRSDINIKPKINFSLTSPRILQRKRSKSNLDKKPLGNVSPTKSLPPKQWPSPSTTVTTAKPSFHKPGYVPSFISRSGRQSIEIQLNTCTQAFKKDKRKLGELQASLMSRYTDLLEMQKKVQKDGGRDIPVERLELLAFVPIAGSASSTTKFITSSSKCNVSAVVTPKSTSSATTNGIVDAMEFSNRHVLNFVEFEMQQMNMKNLQMGQKFLDQMEQLKQVHIISDDSVKIYKYIK